MITSGAGKLSFQEYIKECSDETFKSHIDLTQNKRLTMCSLIRIKSGVNSGQQAIEKIQFEGTIAQKLEAISRVASCSTIKE